MPSIGSTRIDDTSASGRGIVIETTNSISVNPLVESVVLSQVVPTGEVWRLKYAEVACRGFGKWQIKIDGIRVGGGLTNAAKDHDRTDLPDFFDVISGQTVEVLYLYSHGPASISIDVFVGAVVI